MRTKLFWLGAALLATAPLQAADDPPGKQVFARFCAECHAPGPGHPGTQQLGWTRGQPLAVLEARKDLSPELIAVVVRNGLLEMPPYRPTEISDEDLRKLGQYLSGRRGKR